MLQDKNRRIHRGLRLWWFIYELQYSSEHRYLQTLHVAQEEINDGSTSGAARVWLRPWVIRMWRGKKTTVLWYLIKNLNHYYYYLVLLLHRMDIFNDWELICLKKLVSPVTSKGTWCDNPCMCVIFDICSISGFKVALLSILQYICK